MALLPRLIRLYEDRGFTISTGLNPLHFQGLKLAPFTWLVKDGESWTRGLGISAQEIFFLEGLFETYRPRNLLVIGNSFGWSTLALAMLNPEAKIVALDSGFDNHSLEGIALTNEIAAEEGLRVLAVEGSSPEDVPPNVMEHLGGRVDCSFVDGLHTNEQVTRDYEAIRPFAPPEAVYLFHDVHDYDLYPAFERIRETWSGESRVLLGTPSGMAILYGEELSAESRAVIDAFTLKDNVRPVLDRAIWQHRNHTWLRRRRKWGRRKARLLNLLGWRRHEKG